jgi:hypothetical protein
MKTLTKHAHSGQAIFAILAMLLAIPSALADDLAKIDRTIGKQPTYTTKHPKYCLVVPDPAAKTRIWLVLDGEALYVDRNGNGDLTDDGGKIEPHPVFLTGLRVPGQKEPRSLRYECDAGQDWQISVLTIDGNYVQVDVKDKRRGRDFSCSSDAEGPLQFADTPGKAPIICCSPLAIRLSGAASLPRGDKPANLMINIGAKGFGAGTSGSINVSGVPAGKHPVAEIEFPDRNQPGQTIKLKVVLDQRC